MSSPACTELEMLVMDWLAKLLQLPDDFLSGGKGGGVIQVSICLYWSFGNYTQAIPHVLLKPSSSL